jgi:hypothetical protein
VCGEVCRSLGVMVCMCEAPYLNRPPLPSAPLSVSCAAHSTAFTLQAALKVHDFFQDNDGVIANGHVTDCDSQPIGESWYELRAYHLCPHTPTTT